MTKLIVLIIILIIGLFRWIFARGMGRKASYMLISLFVQTLPFAYGKTIYIFLKGQLTEDNETVRLGEFGTLVRIEMPLFFILILLVLGYHNIKRNSFDIRQNKWFYIMLAFCILSMVNPHSSHPMAALTLIIPVIQFLLLFKLIEANFSRMDVITGIFDGLMMVSILQFTLAMCYPVLGLEFVAALFKGDEGFEWSNRRGMSSAIGTFGHPGHLALYCLIISFFFLSCFLNGYKQKIAIYLVILNCVTLILTFSRVSIACAVIILPVLMLIQKRGNAAFSLKSIFYFLGSSFLFAILIYLSPIGYLFYQSDSSLQLNNRFFHWILGYQMWEKSKLIGIGINTHVYYMLNKMSINADMPVADMFFFLRSPIHNIHVIVLAETGILGIGAWIYFFTERLKALYQNCKTTDKISDIFNLTYLGILVAIFIYGFTGWTPFNVEVFSLVFLMGNFSSIMPKKRRALLENIQSSTEIPRP